MMITRPIVIIMISIIMIKGIFFNLPLTTWSTPYPLHGRSRQEPLGIPHLPWDLGVGVQVENAQALFALPLIKLCVRHGIPVGIMHPISSLIWSHPLIKPLFSLSTCQQHILDLCQYGSNRGFRSTIVLWNFAKQLSFKTCGSGHL